MIRIARSVRARYLRSWIGVRVAPSRGLMLVITAAIVATAVTVPWLNDRNAAVAREQVARNALEDSRRDCVRAALSGADIKATAMAGVQHAEDTAHVLAVIRDTLVELAPNSQATARIAPEVDQYVVGVAAFRAVAEQYEPRSISECRDIGFGVLDPLPTNPTVPN